MKKLVIGILAHVDAGKTTLSESLLYQSGSIRKLGRVDHGDAFLDTYELERARGITIFSKQAVFSMGDREITLLDTPGHVDFSAEMERTLQVLDYAIFVINGADGVQGHTQTLWRLLNHYKIPTFLFVNKMDQPGTDREVLMAELKKRLDDRCIDFSEDVEKENFYEELAMCEENALETFLESGEVTETQITEMIAARKAFPCFFGSALKMTGVDAFIEGLQQYTRIRSYPETFGAKVFKIARDEQGNRLTYLKITGGRLKVKELLRGTDENGEWEEKADQIRIYSGAKYESVPEAEAGTICAVTGLTKTKPGQGLGGEEASTMPVLEPVLTYQIILPPECNVHTMLLKLRQLEEEEPELHIVWNETLGEIHAQLMGEVQIEILKSLIYNRFGVEVTFGAGNIVYKETIAEVVEGVGHFEPLRHYAEVHLLLEPGERGSGMQFFAACSEDILDRNWQRLILTHLEEKEHIGVLTGSAITDMRISLLTGKAHLKHTEGGDFRQATYRAIRQGLKKAKSVLLEPYYEFRLEIPSELLGRAISDIQRMNGSFDSPETEGEFTILTGNAPVSLMRDYQTEVNAYSRGKGRLSCSLKGYEVCHNTEEVVEQIGYDSERDLENPTGSVFCTHGAGFVVSWDQVEDYMHLDSGFGQTKEQETRQKKTEVPQPVARREYIVDDEELKEIFARTYGANKKERPAYTKQNVHSGGSVGLSRPRKPKEAEEYLLVDGYNIIFDWEELKELSETNMAGARTKLMDILSNYQGYKKCHLILVFDAYKVEGNPGEILKYHNIHVVYTKEAETADQYIEKTVHVIGRKYNVTVATSDNLEQVIIMAQGAQRMSAQNLREEIEIANRQIREECENLPVSEKNYLFDHLDQEMADYMEEVRLGKKEFKQTR